MEASKFISKEFSMSMSKKRPTFLRLVISLLLGALISGGILFWAQPHYQAFADASIFSQPFLIIAGIAAPRSESVSFSPSV